MEDALKKLFKKSKDQLRELLGKKDEPSKEEDNERSDSGYESDSSGSVQSIEESMMSFMLIVPMTYNLQLPYQTC